jgi:hypothetical protein
LPTVQHAHELGVKVFVAHKGLPLLNFDPAFNHPDDVVAVSRVFPDMKFVIYHAAWDPTHVEGPYEGALPSPWVPRGPVSRREILSWLASSASLWTPL